MAAAIAPEPAADVRFRAVADDRLAADDTERIGGVVLVPDDAVVRGSPWVEERGGERVGFGLWVGVGVGIGAILDALAELEALWGPVLSVHDTVIDMVMRPAESKARARASTS